MKKKLHIKLVVEKIELVDTYHFYKVMVTGRTKGNVVVTAQKVFDHMPQIGEKVEILIFKKRKKIEGRA